MIEYTFTYKQKKVSKMYKDLRSELKEMKNARDYFLTRINYETSDSNIIYFKLHLEKVINRITEIERKLGE